VAQLDYRREPALLLAIAVAASIWGAMTFILYHLIVTLLRPKQRLTLDKNGDRWHFQSWISPRQNDHYPLSTVSGVILQQGIQNRQTMTHNVIISLHNAQTHQFIFDSQGEGAEQFAQKIAQFLPVALIRR